MGAKTALLAFTDDDLCPALLGATRCDQAEAEELVREVHPGYDVTPIGDGTLLYSTNPPDNITYATVLAGGRTAVRRPTRPRSPLAPARAPAHGRPPGGGSSCTGCTR